MISRILLSPLVLFSYFLKSFLLLVFFTIVFSLATYIPIRFMVENSVNTSIYSPSEVPFAKTILVLGAEVYPNQIPSPALAHRLDLAIELYKKGKGEQLLMSGDGRSQYYNEVITMEKYAVRAGVPSENIIKDNAGLRTYESCARAKSVFNLDSVIVVTQREHLLRTLYSCKNMGISSVGVVANEFLERDFTSKMYTSYYFREKAALILAWLDVKKI